MASKLVCYDCGRRVDAPAVRCSCGEPLWFDVDVSDFEWPSSSDTSMWRYDELLPDVTATGVGTAAGGTPLVRTSTLDDYANCNTFVKYEAEEPTGTFKDRGSAVGVAWAAAEGSGRVGTVSHGNMGMSMAAHAAAMDQECFVLVPNDIPAERLTYIAQYDPTIVRIEGDYGDLYYDTIDLSRRLDITFVNSDVPLRVAGQKTVALEICEAFAPEVPDGIVVPVSSGGHASAVWKGLRELHEAGVIATIPSLYLVQAAAVDPIATAYRDGASSVSATDRTSTIAYSIANADPPSGNRALAAARETDGVVTSVSEDAIRDATETLATDAGLCVEPSSAVSLAGLRKLADDGWIDSSDEIVMITTGTGFKEGSETSVESTEIDLSSLERELPTLFS